MRDWPEFEFVVEEKDDTTKLECWGMLQGKIFAVSDHMPTSTYKGLSNKGYFHGKVAMRYIEKGLENLNT